MDGTRFDSIGLKGMISGNGDGARNKDVGTCPDENTFAGYLDDRLDRNEKDSVEMHLAGCPICRNDFYEIRMLLNQDSAEAPKKLATRVKENLQTHDGAPPQGRKIKI